MQATEAGGEWLHTSLVQFQRFVYSNFCETLPFFITGLILTEEYEMYVFMGASL